jgi:O-antigen/teichoic acid export membrane protein
MSTRKNIFYNGLLSVSQVIFPMVTFPYATHVLGPEKLGTINFADSFCKYIMLIAALGIPVYGIREISKVAHEKTKLAKVFSEIFCIHFLTTVLILAAYVFCILFVDRFSVSREVYWWGGLMIFFNLFSIEWFFSGLSHFKFIALRSFLIRMLFVGLVFLFVRDAGDYVTYFVLLVLTVVATGVFNMVYLFKIINPITAIDFSGLLRHLKPLVYLFSAIFAINIYITLDKVILGFLAGDTSVGYYSAVLRINNIALSIIGSFGIVIYPQLTRLYAENRMEDFTQMANKLVNLVIAVCLPIAIGFCLCAPEIINIVAGKNFSTAILPMQVLCLLCMLISLSNIFGNLVLASMSKDKQFSLSAFGAAIISLVLSGILIPAYKELGAAIANLCAEVAICVLTFFFARKYIHFDISFKKLLINACICIPYVLIIFFFKYLCADIWLRSFAILICSLIYFIFSQLFLLKNSLFIELFNTFKRKLIGFR